LRGVYPKKIKQEIKVVAVSRTVDRLHTTLCNVGSKVWTRQKVGSKKGVGKRLPCLPKEKLDPNEWKDFWVKFKMGWVKVPGSNTR
jgi:hypothetical protein